MTLKSFLEHFDFDYKIVKNEDGEKIIKLIDKTGTNLGNIESDYFFDAESVVDRLDIYYHDYIYEEICSSNGYKGEEYYPDILEFLQFHDSTLKDLVHFIVHGDELVIEDWDNPLLV